MNTDSVSTLLNVPVSTTEKHMRYVCPKTVTNILSQKLRFKKSAQQMSSQGKRIASIEKKIARQRNLLVNVGFLKQIDLGVGEFLCRVRKATS